MKDKNKKAKHEKHVEDRDQLLDAGLGYRKGILGAEEITAPPVWANVNFCETHAYGNYHEDGTCHGSYLNEIREKLVENRIEAKKVAEEEKEGEIKRIRKFRFTNSVLEDVDDHPLIQFKKAVVDLSYASQINHLNDNKGNNQETMYGKVEFRRRSARIMETLINLGDYAGVPMEETLEYLLASLKGTNDKEY